MTNEKLIEEARAKAALRFTTPDDTDAALARMGFVQDYVAHAEAHKPTDDERKIVCDLIWGDALYSEEIDIEAAATRLITHFRRSDAPEPSARMIDTYTEQDLRRKFGIPEPPGEPSDAQLQCSCSGEGAGGYHAPDCDLVEPGRPFGGWQRPCPVEGCQTWLISWLRESDLESFAKEHLDEHEENWRQGIGPHRGHKLIEIDGGMGECSCKSWVPLALRAAGVGGAR